MCIFMLVIAFERLAKAVWPSLFSPQAVFVVVSPELCFLSALAS